MPPTSPERQTKTRQGAHPYTNGDKRGARPSTPSASSPDSKHEIIVPSSSASPSKSTSSPRLPSLPIATRVVSPRRPLSEPEAGSSVQYRWNTTSTESMPMDFTPYEPHHLFSRRGDPGQHEAQPSPNPPSNWLQHTNGNHQYYHYAPHYGSSHDSPRRAASDGIVHSPFASYYAPHGGAVMDRTVATYPRFPPPAMDLPSPDPNFRYGPTTSTGNGSAGHQYPPSSFHPPLPPHPESLVSPQSDSFPSAPPNAPTNTANLDPGAKHPSPKVYRPVPLPASTSSNAEEVLSPHEYFDRDVVPPASPAAESTTSEQEIQAEEWPGITSTLGTLCARAGVHPPFNADQLVVVWDGRLQRAIRFDSTEALYLEPHEENELIVFPRGGWIPVKDKHGYDATPWSSGKGANDWLRAQAEHCLCKRFRFWQGEKREPKHPSVIRDHVSACAARDAMDPLARLCRLERQAEKRAKEARLARSG